VVQIKFLTFTNFPSFTIYFSRMENRFLGLFKIEKPLTSGTRLAVKLSSGAHADWLSRATSSYRHAHGVKAPFRSHRSARSAVRTPPFPPVRSAGPPRFSSPAVVPQLSFLEACAKLSVRATEPRSLAVQPKSRRRSPTSAAGECYRHRGCVPPSRHRCARFTAVGSSRCCCAATVPTTASAPGR
jgi:hypothetical protein